MNINVKNLNSREVTIDIEGVIGVDENFQFQENQSDSRVSTYEKFRQEVENIERSEAKTIRVNIRSMGGSVQDALLIYSELCRLTEVASVETHCYGFSASAATIIAQAASPSKRFVASSALYMIHRASALIDGNATQLNSALSMLEKTDAQIAELYAQRSGLPVEHFVELMGRSGGEGEWLTPHEAVEAGLADEVEKFSAIRGVINTVKDIFKKLTSKSDVNRGLSTEVINRSINNIDNYICDCTATQTEPKEDPLIEHYSVELKGNRRSYNHDLELFRDR